MVLRAMFTVHSVWSKHPVFSEKSYSLVFSSHRHMYSHIVVHNFKEGPRVCSPEEIETPISSNTFNTILRLQMYIQAFY